MLQSGLSARECLVDYLRDYWLGEYPDLHPIFRIQDDRISFRLSDARTMNSSSQSPWFKEEKIGPEIVSEIDFKIGRLLKEMRSLRKLRLAMPFGEQ